ncbi:MAG TPA: putative sporulation protein YtxC [Verrucomicrobiae bacterium]|nr:putative sporulation protein YtxC [Verrucomicrobiae bacterium]
MGISIGAREYVEGLRDVLSLQFSLTDLDVKLAEQQVGGFTFINCNPARSIKNNDKIGERLFKHNVANALAEMIIINWEKELIARELKQNHQYFDEQERHLIYDKVLRVLNNQTLGLPQVGYRASRKTKIVQKVLDYLEINDKIILEGFIKFRLKDYSAELRSAISLAVEEYLIEKEYHEFIRLLKYFVDIQEPKVDILHVLVKGNGGFQLYDHEHKLITSDFLEGFVVDIVDNEITYEDLLISALITIAPRFVVLHMHKYQETETLKTIRNVFGDRVSNCLDCELCNPLIKR